MKTYEDYIKERKIKLKELSKLSKEELLNLVNRNYRVHGLSKKSSKEDLIYTALDITHGIPKHIIKQHRLNLEIEAANKDASEMSRLLNY